MNIKATRFPNTIIIRTRKSPHLQHTPSQANTRTLPETVLKLPNLPQPIPQTSILTNPAYQTQLRSKPPNQSRRHRSPPIPSSRRHYAPRQKRQRLPRRKEQINPPPHQQANNNKWTSKLPTFRTGPKSLRASTLHTRQVRSSSTGQCWKRRLGLGTANRLSSYLFQIYIYIYFFSAHLDREKAGSHTFTWRTALV